jgi:hypothetical protein
MKIRALYPSRQLSAAPCAPCAQPATRGLGDITADDITAMFSDWKTWALIAAVALALYLAFANTPKRQERSVKRRAARGRYRDELTKIRAS